MVDEIVDLLKSISTWRRVGMIATTAVIGLCVYAGVKLVDTRVDYVKTIAGKARISVSEVQYNGVKYEIDNFNSKFKGELRLLTVRIYQPKNLPKETSEMIYAVTPQESYKEILEHPLIRRTRLIRDNPMIYYELQKSEYSIVESGGRDYISKYMDSIEGEKHGVIYGLYKYGTPYGILTIVAKEESFFINNIQSIKTLTDKLNSILFTTNI